VKNFTPHLKKYLTIIKKNDIIILSNEREVSTMTFMSFVCDYAKVSPLVLMYRVDKALRDVGFSTYTDVDEDRFVLSVMPYSKAFDAQACGIIANLVDPYLFDSKWLEG
jgi:hypothetical protein